MSDGTLVVDFAALRHASGEIQTALNRLESQLSELERDAAPLVATWEGEAKRAYGDRQTKWRQAAADLSAILRNIKQALDESAVDYQHTEKRNIGLFE
jgi:6 kDa early secretory antigenic target